MMKVASMTRTVEKAVVVTLLAPWCLGYSSYVELVEPAGNRACIRCCYDPSDCDVSQDEAGCETVIPGKYDC